MQAFFVNPLRAKGITHRSGSHFVLIPPMQGTLRAPLPGPSRSRGHGRPRLSVGNAFCPPQAPAHIVIPDLLSVILSAAEESQKHINGRSRALDL